MVVVILVTTELTLLAMVMAMVAAVIMMVVMAVAVLIMVAMVVVVKLVVVVVVIIVSDSCSSGGDEMASCGKVRDGFSVMGLSGSVGHGDPDMMMPLLTNPWLGLSQFWVSTLIADANSILALRVFFPLHRGVIVRAMMIWFIHGVFFGYARPSRFNDNSCRRLLNANLRPSTHMESRNHIGDICREALQRRLWFEMYNRMGLH
ncbi:unnamed protein product [Arabidopsis lyrata]|uniref:Predicted protein n=1 Tax=Arabidopsis lyrata subsp. lyrata TaxID=81972 RepID=D7MW84_ARALL|nr:predicted protein [Arabidopsis lyrata subsp. lyrata]CAH8264428.1 unnamed protein product [Arabidopsis lyrata]